jgi:hypothetical protein
MDILSIRRKMQQLHFENISVIIVVFIVSIFAAGCDRSPNIRNKLLKVLDLTLNVEMIDTVRQGEAAISWTDFRGKYRNISVVYLQDGCTPC